MNIKVNFKRYLNNGIIINNHYWKNCTVLLMIGAFFLLGIGSVSAQLLVNGVQVLGAGGGSYPNSLNSNTTFTILDQAEYTFPSLSGAGSTLTLNTPNSGILTMTGTSDYGGGTTINSGTFRINAPILGSGNIHISAGAIFDYNNNQANNIYNSLSGSGTFLASSFASCLGDISQFSGVFESSDGKILQITNSNLLNSNSFIINGSLGLDPSADNITIGDLSGTNSGAIVYFNNAVLTPLLFKVGAKNTNTLFAGFITAPAGRTINFEKIGSGTMIITGEIRGDINTTITEGTLQFGDGGTTGTNNSTNAVITNNKFLSINRSDNFTFNSTIVGTGTVRHIGTGTTTITNMNNTYSGATIIERGTLELAVAGLAETGGGANQNTNYVVKAGATLTVSQPYQLDYNGNKGVFIDGGTLNINTLTFCTDFSMNNGRIVSTGGDAGLRIVSSKFDKFLSLDGVNNIDHITIFKLVDQTGANFHVNSGTTTISFIDESSDVAKRGAQINKTGAGTLLLNGNNSYTGQTVISDGLIGGTGFCSNSVFWLKRGEAIADNPSIFGGTGSGNSGTLTFKDLFMFESGILKVYSDGSQLSKLSCGAVLLNQVFTVDLEDPMPIGTFTIIEGRFPEASIVPILGKNNSGRTPCFAWVNGKGLVVTLSGGIPDLNNNVNDVCNTTFIEPQLPTLENFSSLYSFDNGVSWIESNTSPSPPTFGCYSVKRRYSCKSNSAVVITGAKNNVVIFPPTPTLSNSGNVCGGGTLVLPTITTVNGFTSEYSIDGATYTSSPAAPSSTGCHSIRGRYVLATSCGTTNIGASGQGSCAESSISNFVIFPATPTLTAPGNICVGGTLTLPTIASVNGFNSEYSIDGGAYTTSPTTPSTAGCHSIRARYVLATGCGSNSAGTLGATGCVESSISNFVIFPAVPTLTTPTNVCLGGTLTLPTISSVNGFTSEYSIDGGAYTTSPTTPSMAGCHSIRARYVLSSGCGSNSAGAVGTAGCVESLISNFVIFPAVPTLTALTNVCLGGTLTLPTIASVNGFTSQYSIDGGAYTTSPTTPSTAGCHSIRARYVLASGCGSNSAGAMGVAGCVESSISNFVIFPAVPTLTAPTNVCLGGTLTLPTISSINGFTSEYSIDGGAYTTSPTTPSTAGCHSIRARYVLSSGCGSIQAGASGTAGCVESSISNFVIFPSAPTLTQPNSVCEGETITLPTATSVQGFSLEYSYNKDGGAFSAYSTNLPPLNTVGKYLIKAKYIVASNCGDVIIGNSAPASCSESTIIEVSVNKIPDKLTVGTVTQPTCGISTGSVSLSGFPVSKDGWVLIRLDIQTSATVLQDILDMTNPATDKIAVGSYSFTVKDKSTNCISKPTETVVIELSAGSPQISGPSSVCVGKSVNLMVVANSGTGGTWSWSPVKNGAVNISASGTVVGVESGTVNIVFTSSQCSATKSFVVKPPPTISTSAKMCIGASIDVLGDDLPALLGTWVSSSANKVTVPRDGNQAGKLEGIAIGFSDIVYNNIDGCSSLPVRITVYGRTAPEVSVTQESNCKESTVTITTTLPNDGDVYLLRWYDKKNNLLVPPTPFTFRIVKDTSLFVVAINSGLTTCKSELTEVPIKVELGVSFNGSIKTVGDIYNVAFGEMVSFEFVGNVQVTHMSWDFGDKSMISTGKQPSHYYYHPGKFEVTLTVDGGQNCINTFKLPQPIVVSGKEFEVITADNQSASDSEIHIFPIPTLDVLEIKSNKLLKKLCLYNLNMECLLVQYCGKETEHSINMEKLSNGLYILEIESDDGLKRIKVLKQ